jgi:hypothetical protein
MCLSAVTESYDRPWTLIVDGWKAFVYGSGNKVRFDNFGVNGSRDVPLDKWIQATAEYSNGKDISASNGKQYKPGFHVYTDEEQLTLGLLRRVFVRNITCSGRQYGKNCVIAQEMYVPSDPNGWPPKLGDDKGLLDHDEF